MENKLRKELHYLVTEWIRNGETSENYYTGKDNTTIEKEQIRQSRLEYFLPHLEKEFPEFKKRVRDYYFVRNNGCLFTETKAILFTYILLNVFCYLTFYDWGMFSEALSQLYPEGSLLLGLVQILEFISPVLFLFIYDWSLKTIAFHKIIGRFGGPTEKELEELGKTDYPYKGLPYTEAFMIANGFIREEARQNWELRALCAPPDIKDMNFNEFIEFMKLYFEPTTSSYESQDWIFSESKYEYKTFNCIFFYQNQKTHKQNEEKRVRLSSWVHNAYNRLPSYDISSSIGTNYNTTTTSYLNKPSYSPKKSKLPKGCTINDCIEESIKMEVVRKILDID